MYSIITLSFWKINKIGIHTVIKESWGKTNVIRIKDRIRSDFQFIKGVIGINLGSTEDDVIENLIKMFKQKR
jgi:hypothetical protein